MRMVLLLKKKISTYCTVNIVGAAMCGQNLRPLNYDETNCFGYISCVPVDVCLFVLSKLGF